jgi:hypothetical protein
MRMRMRSEGRGTSQPGPGFVQKVYRIDSVQLPSPFQNPAFSGRFGDHKIEDHSLKYLLYVGSFRRSRRTLRDVCFTGFKSTSSVVHDFLTSFFYGKS